MIRIFGREYPVKTLETPGLAGLSISTEELNDALMLNGNYASEEARLIDEQIFYYVPQEVFAKTDEEIIVFIKRNI